MANQAKTVTIEDAQLIFKNFAGEEDKYNRAGDRNFSVILPDDLAAVMEKDGWNVKWLEPRDEGDTPTAYIAVAVGYKFKPPRVTMITSTARTPLTEDMVGVLDYADMEMVDLIIRGFDWDVNGKQGTKAYLQTMFVTIAEDELERKYAQGPAPDPKSIHDRYEGDDDDD